MQRTRGRSSGRFLPSFIFALMLLVGVVIGTPASSLAVPHLDFGLVAPTPGTIGFAGGATPLVGQAIQVDNLVGLDTPANNFVGVLCISCQLNFVTGNFMGVGGLPPSQTWEFDGGGVISIVGGLDLTGDGDALDANDIPTGTTLLAGSFVHATVVKVGSIIKIAGANFLDQKDDRLLAFYGIPQLGLLQGNFNISFMAAGTPPNGFISSAVFSGDVLNTIPVPEPASLLVFASGLVGLAMWGQRHVRGSCS